MLFAKLWVGPTPDGIAGDHPSAHDGAGCWGNVPSLCSTYAHLPLGVHTTTNTQRCGRGQSCSFLVRVPTSGFLGQRRLSTILCHPCCPDIGMEVNLPFPQGCHVCHEALETEACDGLGFISGSQGNITISRAGQGVRWESLQKQELCVMTSSCVRHCLRTSYHSVLSSSAGPL